MIVIRKEIISIAREKRALALSLFLPMLILPVSLYILEIGAETATSDISESAIIGTTTSNLEIVEGLFSEIATVIISEDMESELKNGEILLFIEAYKKADGETFRITNNSSSLKSQYLSTTAEQMVYEYQRQKLLYLALSKGASESELPKVELSIQNLGKSGDGKYYIEILLPIMLLVYGCIGITTVANDLGAGEKERKTLFSLLATSTKREHIFWGKVMVASFMGLVSSIFLIVGLQLYLLAIGESLWGSISQISYLLIISVLFCILVAVISVTISTSSKTYKEAQTLNSPLSIIFLLPGYFLMSMDAGDLVDYYFHIPVLNLICSLKEVSAGTVSVKHVIVLSSWMCVYTLIFSAIGVKRLKSEKILDIV